MDEIKPGSLYLGQPFVVGRSKEKAFNFLMEKMMNKVAGWKGKVLSFAGREILIKSVLSSLPNYTMMHFALPKGLCSNLNTILRKFWWNHDQEKNKNFCPLAWEKICCPKEKGGLGIRLVEDTNKALLAKLAWEMATNANKIWVKACQQKYCTNNNFMDIEKASSNSSLIWKGIMEARKAINGGLCIKIGDGRNTNPFIDPWIPSLQGFKPAVETRLALPNIKVAHFIDKEEKKWKTGVLNRFFSTETCKAIEAIKIPNAETQDELKWIHSLNGKFDVRSCYLANIQSQELPFQNITTKIWKSKIHHRHKIFLWRIIRNAIPTKELLKSRKIIKDSECMICIQENESNIHLFANCPMARALWFARWGMRTDKLENLSMASLIDSILDSVTLGNKNMDYGTFRNWGIACLSTIWKMRNELLFKHDQNQNWNVKEILIKIEEMSNEIAEPIQETSKSRNRMEYSEPLEYGYVKINHDASYANKRGTSASIATNHRGDTIHMTTKMYPCKSALMAETIGLWEATELAERKAWKQVIFVGDCQILHNAIISMSSEVPWQTENWIMDIKEKASRNKDWKFRWVYREQNIRADLLARWAVTNSFEGNIVEDFLV